MQRRSHIAFVDISKLWLLRGGPGRDALVRIIMAFKNHLSYVTRRFVPHDLPGLVELYGKDNYIKKLSTFFDKTVNDA